MDNSYHCVANGNSIMFQFGMMTSSNGNIFRVAGLLSREFTGDQWIPRKASDVQLWCFIWSAPEQAIE